ncbi:MAG: AsmA family protein [Gammaproteobacteria bacterium]|jgi:AsmA protein|nr:AsmA family protein [Gammaproteobacteria bacterium]
MGKVLKILVILVVVLVLLVAGGAAAIVMLVDPNDYRGEIEAAVEENTGRELTLGGEIGLSVFPWLGLTLNDARLSNAPGFGDEPFAEVGEVEIRVKLLPLLSNTLEMETARLVGLKVNLARDDAGHANWDDLAGGGKHDDDRAGHDQAHEREGRAMAALAIGGIEISDSALTWEDRQAGQRYALQNVSLTTGEIGGGRPVDLALGFDVESDKPQMAGRIELTGRITADQAAQRISIAGTQLKADLKGDGLPGGAFDATINADISADMAKQTASLANLRIATLGLQATGKVDATGLQDAPQVNGQLSVAEFGLAALTNRLGVELPEGVQADKLGNAKVDATFSATDKSAELQQLVVAIAGGTLEAQAKVPNLEQPSATGTLAISDLNPRVLLAAAGQALETADPQALTMLNLKSGFSGSANHVELKGLDLALDQSKLAGSLSVKDFAKPAIRFGLELDAIDADRYLPPPAQEPPPAGTPGAAAGAAAQLPLEPLRALDIDGTLKIGKLKAYNLNSSNIVLRLTASNGQLRVNPAKAQMYDGRYQGNIGLDVRSDTPKLSLDESLTGVQVGPLLRDLTGKEEKLTGRAQMNAKLTAEGSAPEAIQKTLNGNAAFAFTDGAVKGFNLSKLIRDAKATLSGAPVTGSSEEQTDFSELTGTAKITNGVIDNRDLAMKSPGFRVAGEGIADLPKQQVDYLVKASIVGTSKGQGGKELESLKGVTVPVRIKGSLSDPGYAVDVAALATDQVKQRAAQEIDKALQKQLGGDTTSEGEAGTGDPTKDLINKGLKGLFGN